MLIQSIDDLIWLFVFLTMTSYSSASTGAALMDSPLRFESPGGEDIVKGVGFTQPVGIVVLGSRYSFITFPMIMIMINFKKY